MSVCVCVCVLVCVVCLCVYSFLCVFVCVFACLCGLCDFAVRLCLCARLRGFERCYACVRVFVACVCLCSVVY